jgi:hypothetical protein
VPPARKRIAKAGTGREEEGHRGKHRQEEEGQLRRERYTIGENVWDPTR